MPTGERSLSAQCTEAVRSSDVFEFSPSPRVGRAGAGNADNSSHRTERPIGGVHIKRASLRPVEPLPRIRGARLCEGPLIGLAQFVRSRRGSKITGLGEIIRCPWQGGELVRYRTGFPPQYSPISARNGYFTYFDLFFFFFRARAYPVNARRAQAWLRSEGRAYVAEGTLARPYYADYACRWKESGLRREWIVKNGPSLLRNDASARVYLERTGLVHPSRRGAKRSLPQGEGSRYDSNNMSRHSPLLRIAHRATMRLDGRHELGRRAR